MGFYEINKEFVKQKIEIEFENFSPDLRTKKYLKIQGEVRRRIIASYNIISEVNTERGQILSKYFFYRDLITYLGEYESDYLLMNLFLEPYFQEILFIFEKEEELSNFLSVRRKIKSNYLIIFLAYFVKSTKLKNIEGLTKNGIKNQIKKYFNSCLSSNGDLWLNVNYNSRESFNKLYPSQVLSELSKGKINWSLIIFNHLLFIKAWNSLEYFKKKSKTKRALILDEFKHHFLDKNSVIINELQQFEQIIFLFHEAIFVNNIKSPYSLLDIEILDCRRLMLIKEDITFIKKNEDYIIETSKKNYLELIQFFEENKEVNQIIQLIYPNLIKEINDLINKINIKNNEIKNVKNIFNYWSKNEKLINLYNSLSAKKSKFREMKSKKLKKKYYNLNALVLLNKFIDKKISSNQYITQKELTSVSRYISNSEIVSKSKRLIFKRLYLFEKL